jgi:hypothetical protein
MQAKRQISRVIILTITISLNIKCAGYGQNKLIFDQAEKLFARNVI